LFEIVRPGMIRYVASFLLGLILIGSCINEKSFIEKESNLFYQQASVPEVIDFNFHVRPILSDKCFKCHGPDKAKIEAGLSFASEEDAFKALQTDHTKHAIIPGDTTKSVLVERIKTTNESIMMPPPDSYLVLSNYEKEVLIKWIDQGAKWKKHWSFLPLAKVNPPSVNGDVYNEIDNFVLAKLEGQSLDLSNPAAKNYLIRRIAFDLTGLPPTIKDIEDYINNSSPSATEDLIDKYLNSIAYAENMTSYWLDVARYADTHGYQDDLERTMWPWRDWVIHAFNTNMKYDDFVSVQLSGDLLPNATKEQIIATAFNRNHKITQEGGVIPEEYRVEYVADRTLTFGKAFLGLSMECARCHDHKYDPISQEDYFSLFAFFNNVPEKGLITEYGGVPDPYIKLTKKEIDEQLTFINNLDTLEEIPLMVMKDQKKIRKTYILNRGEYDKPTREVFAKPPSSLNSFASYKPNRKGLSDWLFDKSNPLTSRVIVNRLWQICFGNGIVATADDFGNQGALPTHPELLDFLAIKFMDEDWDIKKMLKFILMSKTYQQTSRASSKVLDWDPENRFLARAPRLRLTAEKITDHMLATSELLVETVGGPSVKPFQPEGLWQETTGGGGGSTSKYVKDKGDKQYRRSLYTFWKRTVPPPGMLTFDAVTRDFCMVKREVTSTPLQALVMMNDPRIIEASRSLAYIAFENSSELNSQIKYMFYKATSRLPNEEEQALLLSYHKDEMQRFSENLNDAKDLIAIGDLEHRDLTASGISDVDVAALTMVANTIFNLDESITRS